MTISRTVNARCDADPSIHTCILSYSLADPFAVTFRFVHNDGGGNTITPWSFARQLLTDVLASGKAGSPEIGDVLFERRASSVVAFFAARKNGVPGYCKIALPLEDVAIFYAATVGACRPGEELSGCGIESELDALLNPPNLLDDGAW